MPLTPAEVRHVLFSKAPVGRRGYHEDEVDSFLDRVHVELARVIEENNDLRHQLQQRPVGPVDTRDSSARPSADLVKRPMRSPGTGHSSPGVDHGLLTALMLAWAQERADQVTEAANAEVDKMLRQARVDGAQLLSQAQVKAQDMVNEARTRVESMLGDARTTAQAVERQSREKATSLGQHATRKHAEILELHQDKSLLENAIFDLQAFEQEYRTGLALYLSICSHCLMNWTGPDPPAWQTRYALNGILLAPGWAHAVKPVNPRPHRDEPDTVETSWERQPRPPAARVRAAD
jgi:DivIVA domain-containing protein